jgi:hypothetical protein
MTNTLNLRAIADVYFNRNCVVENQDRMIVLGAAEEIDELRRQIDELFLCITRLSATVREMRGGSFRGSKDVPGIN